MDSCPEKDVDEARQSEARHDGTVSAYATTTLPESQSRECDWIPWRLSRLEQRVVSRLLACFFNLHRTFYRLALPLKAYAQ